MKKIIFIFILFALSSFYCHAQSAFTSRLYTYYDSTTIKNNNLYRQLSQDTIISNKGNVSEFILFMDSNKLWDKDTLLSFFILKKIIRKIESTKSNDLFNFEKNRILNFLCNIFIDTTFSIYRSSCLEYLFNKALWNDSVKSDLELQLKFKQIIRERQQYLSAWSVSYFTYFDLEDLYPDIINFMIKPYFDNSESKNANHLIWRSIYYLAIAQNDAVLPYLYKALAESGCETYDHVDKYSSIIYLLTNIEIQKNKQIWLNILKDDCLTSLYRPTIARNDRIISYFELIMLVHLNAYFNFPMEEVIKLSVPQQVEFVRNWINENL